MTALFPILLALLLSACTNDVIYQQPDPKPSSDTTSNTDDSDRQKKVNDYLKENYPIERQSQMAGRYKKGVEDMVQLNPKDDLTVLQKGAAIECLKAKFKTKSALNLSSVKAELSSLTQELQSQLTKPISLSSAITKSQIPFPKNSDCS